MADTFTERTSQSWFSKIFGSFVALLFGIVLVPVAIILLFWNEGRAVATAKSLAEGASSVISAPADAVNADNNLKLVHVSGNATTDEVLTDPTFGVSATAIRLGRKVEMYQWNEVKNSSTQKDLGGSNETTTTYSYVKKWSDDPIDSTKFKEAADHVNPTEMLASGSSLSAKDVSLGAFKLSDSVISQMSTEEPLPLTDDSLGQLPDEMKTSAQIANAGLYFGHDPNSPAIGDQRVSFTVVKPGPFSIVARQNGDTFDPYSTRAGRDLLLVEPGDVAADLMFQHAESENAMLTWILRGVGTVLLFIALAMIFSPISTFASVIPFFGDILGMGTGLAAFFLSLAISLLTISFAWIVYRPLVGGLMLAVAVAVIVWARSHGQGRAKAKAGIAAPST